MEDLSLVSNSMPTCVYLMHELNKDLIKIGFSNAVFNRKKQLVSQKGYNCKVIGYKVFESKRYAVDVETFLHRKYKNNRIEDELFDLSESEIRDILSYFSHPDIKDPSKFFNEPDDFFEINSLDDISVYKKEIQELNKIINSYELMIKNISFKIKNYYKGIEAYKYLIKTSDNYAKTDLYQRGINAYNYLIQTAI